MVVTDGLMALLSGDAFIAMTRAVPAHFGAGELVFNAYSRLAMRNSRRMRSGSPLSIPTSGEGTDRVVHYGFSRQPTVDRPASG